MNLFDSVILNIVLLTFPIILWLFYMVHNKNIGKQEKDLLFDFSLVTSLYLIIRFGITAMDDNLFLIINIPLIMAYSKRRNWNIGFLSLMIIAHCYYSFEIPLFLLLLEYSLYYFIYRLFHKKNNLYITLLSLLKIVVFIIWAIKFEYLPIIGIHEFLNIIMIIFNVILVALIIFGIVDKVEDIVTYHMSLKELEQEKQFRATLFRITHEIKNPIAVCKGYLDMFNVNDIKHSKKYVPILKEEIERTLILLQDFLCMTKIQIEHDSVDINMVLEDVLDNFIPMLKEKEISYDFNVLDKSCYIYGDYNRMTQVFINIVKNGIEAIGSKVDGKLSVKTETLNKIIKITIKDNGIGFTKEQLERLGEPFLTTKPNGTGLGIILSKEIIKGHNGEIKYFSKPNIGTRVEITIPLIDN
ncbi:MAG: HAMP domain-containing sensor histidine kinase [Bacilli bacterium]|nr:HAMP domain-containing sensor histidine kinase [Bacilli bacterium]